MKTYHNIKVGIAFNDFMWIEYTCFDVEAETPEKAFEKSSSKLHQIFSDYGKECEKIEHIWFISSESKDVEV